jgi:hypothetical protein
MRLAKDVLPGIMLDLKGILFQLKRGLTVWRYRTFGASSGFVGVGIWCESPSR